MPFVSQTYDDQSARELYERVLDETTGYETFEPARSPRFRYLLDCVLPEAQVEGLRVLDVGAGGGGFLGMARGLGAEVTGIEFSSAARAHAVTTYGIELSALPVTDPAWDGRRFDVITVWDLLEHLADPRSFLRRIAELLVPGGRVAITTPAREGALHRVSMSLARLTGGRLSMLARHRYNLLHLQIFRRNDLRALLEDAGLTVRTLELISDFSYPGSWYLRTARIPDSLKRVLAPAADLYLQRIPPRNKIVAVARRG
ncbi:MAG: methyltransferase domain-containing protein [Deltaproteobacteria bacterium]|nr:methyltransferase domain-containing protein [Deltaproteobacteria bacterium]